MEKYTDKKWCDSMKIRLDYNNMMDTMISGGEAYSPKVNSNLIKAQQDATRLTGGYNYNTGSFNRTLNGTTDDDLN